MLFVYSYLVKAHELCTYCCLPTHKQSRLPFLPNTRRTSNNNKIIFLCFLNASFIHTRKLLNTQTHTYTTYRQNENKTIKNRQTATCYKSTRQCVHHTGTDTNKRFISIALRLYCFQKRADWEKFNRARFYCNVTQTHTCLQDECKEHSYIWNSMWLNTSKRSYTNTTNNWQCTMRKLKR